MDSSVSGLPCGKCRFGCGAKWEGDLSLRHVLRCCGRPRISPAVTEYPILLEELAPCGPLWKGPGHVYVLAACTGRGLNTKGHILVSIRTPFVLDVMEQFPHWRLVLR